MRPIVPNQTAKRHFLDRHGLIKRPSGAATGADMVGLINQLGFVQVDSINTVARAHDMILWSRRNAYRPGKLRLPLQRDRTLFEHWTHDASIIPMEFFPYWKLKFARANTRLRAKYLDWHGSEFVDKFDAVLERIAKDGRACSADVGTDEGRSSGGWWEWHPSKTALEFLWQTGQLSVCRRVGFRKYYDLTERVIPDEFQTKTPSAEETIDWACNAALDRLGFATSGELAAFWALIKPEEAKAWCAAALSRGEIEEIDIELVDGSLRRSYARPGLADSVAPEPTDRVRILSPFDPALRDRKRAERLFGFDYRIEIFVPAPKRKYGYYVFPVLEGDRQIGRIDMTADRSVNVLNVTAFWPEKKTRTGTGRIARLRKEIERALKLAGVDDLIYAKDWMR